VESKGYTFNIKVLLLTVITLAFLGVIGFLNLNIDTDIVSSLPKKDPVLADAAYVLQHHPMQDLIVIDIGYQKNDPDILVQAGNFVEEELRQSALFKTVEMESFEEIFPTIMIHVSNNLPVLFSEKELTETIKPMLTPESIQQKLKDNYLRLSNINSIGITEMIAHDPLGFSDQILAKLLYLSPTDKADFYKGHLISMDGKHLLVIAEPLTSGTDTDFAKQLIARIQSTSEKLNDAFKSRGILFTIQHIGSYRYAFDNETIAKKDTQRAILFATLGIALMLIIVFPRPLIGLFSFLPAIAGTVTSFFVYSLFHNSISLLALGFGGAVISITVDHGIAYLLFLDQKHETQGKDASREVWSVGLLATLTTVFAFLSLFISGFPILTQVGQFAAFGILFSFIFVHTVFPILFSRMPAARRQNRFDIQHFVNRLALSSKKTKLIGSGVLCFILLFFARPDFHVDLSSLNTINKDTLETEAHIRQTWGNVSDRIFLVSEASSLEELQTAGDKITSAVEEDMANKRLLPSFISSMIFPGVERSNTNFTAWKKFWSKKRIKDLKANIHRSAVGLGFSESAFDPFFEQIQAESFTLPPLPEGLFPFLGIVKQAKDGDRPLRYLQFLTLTPGTYYHADSLVSRYQQLGNVKIFDPNLFTQKLGQDLTAAFIRMFIIIFSCLVIFLLLFFLDFKLTGIALLPVIFAFICTLGTLKILSHPIDIPGLMLSIVVLGMGIDYSLYFARSHQRYLHEAHPSFEIIRTAVFLASISTLIGFGVMCFSRHALLRSAGVTSFFGILFSLVGAFFILPYILNRLFFVNRKQRGESKFSYERTPGKVLKYYRHMEGLARIYARMKLKFDPMYKELGDLLSSPKNFIDIGCGYGVTAVWILDSFPESSVLGFDPHYERARIASNAFKHRGTAVQAKAPNLPKFPENTDTVLMIDMMHYLNDKELIETLKTVRASLNRRGNLLMRTTIPKADRFSFLRWIEASRLKLFHIYYQYRSADKIKAAVSEAGFVNITATPSGKNREKVWFLAVAE